MLCSLYFIVALCGLDAAEINSEASARQSGTLPAPVSSPPISWYDSFDQAQTRAKAANKPLLVYFTFTDCAWARRMEKTTLRDPEIHELLNRFILVKIDIEKCEAFADAMNIRGCPAFIIFVDGQPTRRHAGFLDAPAFRAWLTNPF